MAKLLLSKEIENYLIEVYDDKPNFEVINVNQIHSNIVVSDSQANETVEADAITSTNLESPIGIRTADCVPVIIIGKKGVANIHAGWRGIQQRIVCQDAIKELEPHTAYIAPHIRVGSYEVGEDFKANFPNSKNFHGINFHMEDEIIEQLKSAYPEIEIETCDICTLKNKNYNSYRRDKTTQRNWNIIKRI
jgi:YfiH family protein